MRFFFYYLLGIATFIILGFTIPNKNKDTLSYHLNIPHITQKPLIEQEYINQEVFIEPEIIYQEEYVPQPRGRWAWALVTDYTPGPESCGPYADGFTSIMVNTNSTNPNNVYGIAANPRVLPYGTSVYVPGYWEMLQRNTNLVPTEMTKIDDTGADMRRFRPHWRTIDGQRVKIEFHLDIRVRQVRTALNWGRQYKRVFIYE
jgi:3D (Asp-Asp-Asp) domain-containing protein